ncbi:hypothetical protein H310_15008 [Aphanomyces invadans]|uniref:Uncharacterized protein n=1 Tax=Aphanomyces invadans TaxID=157072 RepID=A0A024T855_9STRA|nr:hypothetical protein H310_15008 [Aphanomyces invadans]ETV90158.1 hypothetical protein H310_15008 [Aphanomyces invadans]|eukprot:XP_008881210.1 hypothetical protein H310_15008 [Aphanomyces invadans]
MRIEGTHLHSAQCDEEELAVLANVLVEVHSNPAGAQRVRLGSGKCERQVAIAFNSAQLERALRSTMANDRVEQDEEVDEEDMEDGEDDEFRNVDYPAMILDQYLGDDEHSEELVMDE